MEKILKPYTIIPPHLYVKRSADRQLRDIISDMGRPGYVLVSRQMGKTNLLLNAKRELGNENDKFIYVDLSNTFDNEQSCFQNIIDLALETNEDSYFEASKIIAESRNQLGAIPPHKQHTNELRVLLKHTKGKLVIILDEIDALTKTQYSDKIFAQIRSVYFSRVNFPELERLTYILSGVVEPSEIIKDPKISPFNIGEKIFLNDFSKEEFIDFVEKAKINTLPEELIERIFYWTNGNPRMTWDLCSEIENNQSTVKTKEQIDDIVQKHYLTSFDKPPIDNIREMIIADKSIRDAIVEIDYNKGSEVADNIKSKLYLAGIINYEENDIKIKNRIIRNSLSRGWLESVKEQEQGLIATAFELLQKGKYDEAIELYDKAINNLEFNNKEEENFAIYHLGLALYNKTNFVRAIEILSKVNFSIKTYPQLVCRIQKIIGICYLQLGELEKSLLNFQFVIDQDLKDFHYVGSLLNYGVTCSKISSKNNDAISAFKQLLTENNFEELTLIEVDEFKSLANNNLGILYQNNDKEEAINYFKKALETQKNDLKTIFYFNLINITENESEKNELLHNLINCIVENNIIPLENDYERPVNISFELFQKIIITAFEINIEKFEILFEYYQSKIYKAKGVDQLLLELAISCLIDKRETTIDILKYSYSKYISNPIPLNNTHQYQTIKYLAYLVKANNNALFSEAYLHSFELKRQEPIDNLDFDIVSNTIIELHKRKEVSIATKYLNLFYSLKLEVSEEFQINYLLLKHLDLQIKRLEGNSIGANNLAKEILKDIENKQYKNLSDNLLGEKGLDDIKERAYNYLYPNIKRIPIISEKLYGRNDRIKVRYNDGRVIENKFKKLENDIINKLCKII